MSEERIAVEEDDIADLPLNERDCGFNRIGRQNRAAPILIVSLNLAGSSTNISCPDCSNQTSFFDGAVRASK